MNGTRTYKVEAIVIRRRNIGEADRILTVFTKHFGKINVKASGVRKITSRRAPHIESLNHSILTLYKGKNSMPLLLEAQTIQNFSEVKCNLKKVGLSYHICELVDRLCPENQENMLVFTLLLDFLYKLSIGGKVGDFIRQFESQLLVNLGYHTGQAVMLEDTSLFIETILEKKL